MRGKLSILCSCFVTAVLTYLFLSLLDEDNKFHQRNKQSLECNEDIKDSDDTNMFMIFIGGMPRSGTTLMRTMIDVHPDIRCGQETHVIPELLIARDIWMGSATRVRRLIQAGVEPIALNRAIGKFILEIMLNHGPPAKYYCNKDPFTLGFTTYLNKLFPNAKFLFMIRDGRASSHSIVSRKVEISGFNISNYRNVIMNWNNVISKMYDQCNEVGIEICLPVYYEQLVLQPVSQTKRIFKFLDIPWSEEVLHHDEYINRTKLSKVEASTDQVKKPLYLDALSSWFGHIPSDVERDMAKIAPMLSILGYDPYNTAPSYGVPDEFVLNKTKGNSNKEILQAS